MKPSIAVEITARDKTAAGRKSAERGFGATSRKVAEQADRSGLSRIGKHLDGLTKFRNLDLGFQSVGRTLSTIGRTSSEVGSGFASATEKALSLRAAGEGAFGAIAEGATVAAGAVAATVTAVVGLGVATYLLGEKWAKTGAEVDRTSKTLAVSARDLQAARAAGERFGVTADQTTASIDALGSTLYDAKYGANNLALGALNQLGVQLKQTKDGAVDVNQAMLDIADAIARQKDPMVQRKLASIFGMSAMLPALRQGSAALKREGADYLGSGAALSDQEVAQASEVNRKTVTAKQHMAGAETRLGVAAMGPTGAAADAGIDMARSIEAGGKDLGARAQAAVTNLVDSGRQLAHSGLEAGRHLVEGGERAAGRMVDVLSDFARRIEHQESRGHQFDRHGRPLTSSRGAIGAMQLLPKTAEAAAKRAGLAWDPKRFRTDKAYNEQLGKAELSRLLEKFDGDQVLAAAAYNAGEGVMAPGGYRDAKGRHHESWLKRFGDPRKGEISDAEFAARIPYAETRDYVEKTVPQAKVEITLRNAPPGTIARVTGAPNLDVDMHVARSLETP